LNVASVQLPPLRRTRDDIQLLCNFLRTNTRRASAAVVGRVDTKDGEYSRYHGGNIREWKNLASARSFEYLPLLKDSSR